MSNKNSNNSNNNFNNSVDSDEEKPPIHSVGPNHNSYQHNSPEKNDREHIYYNTNNELSLWQQFHHHESRIKNLEDIIVELKEIIEENKFSIEKLKNQVESKKNKAKHSRKKSRKVNSSTEKRRKSI